MANPPKEDWYLLRGVPRYWNGKIWKVTARRARPKDEELPTWDETTQKVTPPKQRSANQTEPSVKNEASNSKTSVKSETSDAESAIWGRLVAGVVVAIVSGLIAGLAADEPLVAAFVVAAGTFISSVLILPALIARGVSLGLRHYHETNG